MSWAPGWLILKRHTLMIEQNVAYLVISKLLKTNLPEAERSKHSALKDTLPQKYGINARR